MRMMRDANKIASELSNIQGHLWLWCSFHDTDANYKLRVTCYIVLIDGTFSQSVKLDIQADGSPELNVC